MTLKIILSISITLKYNIFFITGHVS